MLESPHRTTKESPLVLEPDHVQTMLCPDHVETKNENNPCYVYTMDCIQTHDISVPGPVAPFRAELDLGLGERGS